VPCEDTLCHRRDPFGLRTLRRVRLGAPRLALAAFGSSILPSAGQARWPDSLGCSHLHGNPSHSDESGICRLYAYGKTRRERYVDEPGAVKKRMRHLPIDKWSVLIRNIIPDSLTGPPSRRIRNVSTPILARDRIAREES
jgi:hypothetical protein